MVATLASQPFPGSLVATREGALLRSAVPRGRLRSAGQTTRDDARDHRAEQERARATAREAAHLVEELARLATVQPAAEVPGPLGCLAGEVGGQARALGAAGHVLQVKGQGLQGADQAVTLLGRLVVELGHGFVHQGSDLVLGLGGDVLDLFRAHLAHVLGLVGRGRGGLACCPGVCACRCHSVPPICVG